MTKLKAEARPIGSKPAQYCRIVARRAASIQRLLRQFRAERGLRGSMRSATQWVRVIGDLARLGQTASASDAVEIAFRIETYVPILEAKIDQILMTSGRQAKWTRLSQSCTQGDSPMSNELGKTVRILRMAKAKSLSKLATETKLSVPFLSLVESGKRQPSLLVIQKLSKALNVPPDVFFLLGTGPDNELSTSNLMTKGITDSVQKLIEIENKLKSQLTE